MHQPSSSRARSLSASVVRLFPPVVLLGIALAGLLGTAAIARPPQTAESIPNAELPPFSVALRISAVPGHPREARLMAVLVKPWRPRLEYAGGEVLQVDCDACNDRIQSYTDFNKTERFRGRQDALLTLAHPPLITSRTHLGIITYPTDEVGDPGISRYRLYSLSPNLKRQVVTGQGCLGAGEAQGLTHIPQLTPAGVRKAGAPTIPCNGGPPPDDALTASAPHEVSGSSPTTIVLQGTADGPRFLSLYSQQSCDENAAAVVADSEPHARLLVRRLSGRFTVAARLLWPTSIAPAQQQICAYLQTGGKFRDTPDGRLTQFQSATVYANDTLNIDAPSSLGIGQSLSATITGDVNKYLALYEFLSDQPCAASAQDQYASGGETAYETTYGQFSHTLSLSGQFSQATYLCAYLQAPGVPFLSTSVPSSDVTPLGTVLVARFALVAVTGST
jgi:hypothetical protein